MHPHSFSWIVGALDSAWRAVKEILLLDYRNKIPDFESMWGRNEEWYSQPPCFPGASDPHQRYEPEDDLLFKNMLYHLGTEVFDV